MSTHRMKKITAYPKLCINVCFLELSEEFPRDSKNEFESV